MLKINKLNAKIDNKEILKEFSLNINPGEVHAIMGPNGSGKSTLLKVLSGFETPSKGVISYENENPISVEKIHKYVAYTSPYISVFEEYTVKELVSFYTKLKPLKNNIAHSEFIEIVELKNTKEKAIKHFSSGMKQRVKLGLAILSDTPILLLDEPTSNLDSNAILWYQNLIQKNLENRITFVASNNQKDESFFCEREIKIEDYK